MSQTVWTDISTSAYYGDYNGYIRYANQVLNISGTASSSSSNGMRVFSIESGKNYRVTMQMRNRFRLGCVATLTNGQTVTNYVFDSLDSNDSTDQGGTVRTLEITAGTGQVYLCVGAWSSGASETLFNTLDTIIVEEEQNAYTVSFVDWDSTLLKSETVASGGTANPPADPTREGCSFSGWSGSYTNVTADTTVTATYTERYVTYSLGINVTGTLDRTTHILTVSGTGDMTNFGTYDNAPFYNSSESITGIVIESGVTSVGNYIFSNCTGVTSITLPSTLTRIGKSAFYRCTGLAGITIPSSVTTIDDYAFVHCSSLQSISIPASVTSIGEAIALECAALTQITVDSENQYYCSDQYGVLFNKAQTELLQYPPGRQTTTYTIPSTVTAIDNSAFRYSKLTSITIPENVTSIAEGAFYWCNSLTAITVLNANCVIYSGAGTFPSGATIYGYSGSTAETYATTYSRTFVALTVTHTVTFVDWDGTTLDTQTVPDGHSATAPADPIREGYTFNGWDTDFSNVTSDLTVTATYILQTTFTVIFADWDGTTLKSQIVNSGSDATPPSDPARTGYTFSGWSGSYTNITADTTVTATYTILTYTVTFVDWDETVLDTQTVNYGSDATPPSDPARTGYTFSGWSGSYTNVTADTTVTATYTILSFTVTFKDWDETVLDTQTVNYGSAATAPTDPTREGYTFNGWDTDFSNITSDLTVTATYTQQTTFTVTFVDWDGTTLKSQTVHSGSDATPPTNPTREGYSFYGWDGMYTSVTADSTVTAVYIVNSYTVTFSDWDGTLLSTQVVNSGSDATPPANPTREGYSFSGWSGTYTNVTADTTVTATYAILTFTVLFRDWDGTTLKNQTVDYGSDATPPSDPTREGYTFTGWSGVYTNITVNTVITAEYEVTVIYYTVSFYDWNGTLLLAEQVEEGLSAPAAMPPIREGYIFDSWDTDFSYVESDLAVTATYREAISHSVISIYSGTGGVYLQSIDKVRTASVHDGLDGELTFDFSTLVSKASYVSVGCLLEYDGQYYNIVRITKSIYGGLMVLEGSCEHISYTLNDDRYKLSSLDFTGTPSAALALVLTGTPFVPGIVEYTNDVTLQVNVESTRRAVLMQLVALLGGEIEYSGQNINIRAHRGSSTRTDLLSTRNVTDVSVTYESRSDTASYKVSFHKASDFSVGDEVRIVFSPLGIDVNTRIISMEYNPFYRYSIKVEVGDYTPTINDSLYRMEQDVSDSGDDVAEALSAMETINNEYNAIQESYTNFLTTYREVQNIAMGEDTFTVTFAEGTSNVYSYTTDSNGYISSITKTS